MYRSWTSFLTFRNHCRHICQYDLDSTVKRVDLGVADRLDPIQNLSAIRRSDTKGILGVVGPDFEPIQNRQMLNVFRDLAKVGHGGGGLPFSIKTAGCFHCGRVAWALAHMPDLGVCTDDDETGRTSLSAMAAPATAR